MSRARRTLRALVAFAALAAPAVPLATPLAAQGVGPPLGSPAPSAALEDLEGNAVQLADYVVPGKPTLIEFWATWCEQCEALQPQLDRIEAELGERVNVVAVAVGVAQSVRRVRRHLEGHDPGYPYLWDGEGAAVRAYQAPTTAVVVIVNQEGKVAYTGVGTGQDLVGEVRKVLGSG